MHIDLGKRSPGGDDVIRVTWVGVIVNVVLAGLKLILGVLGSSQAVIADAVHSLSDLGTDCAVLCGYKFWSAPADECHPYGHQKIETIITAFIGILLGVAALGIGYHAIVTVRGEHLRQPGWVAFLAAVFSIFSKEILYRWTVKVGRRAGSSAVIANAWHHRTDALSSIPVAAAVAVAAFSPNWSFIDHIGALVVSIFILHTAWTITRSALSQLADEGVSEKERKEIYDVALATEGVKSVHAVRSRRMGAGIYIDLHIMVDGDLSVTQGHKISGLVKYRLREIIQDVIDVIIHLEPFEEILNK
ncbi:MAG: cation transporter [Candidatus Aureabacteria bacterium]|nr:cation transporter [Candidatus Auribacterota bacterium]